jgi:hypothetical protein
MARADFFARLSFFCDKSRIRQGEKGAPFMEPQETGYPRFSFGKTVSDLFGVIGRNLLLLCGLALLLYGLPSAIFTAFFIDSVLSLFSSAGAANTDTLFAGWFSAYWPTLAAGMVGGILISLYTQGAMIWAVLEDLKGERPTFGRALGAGLRFLLPILGITLITYIWIGGLVALPFLLGSGTGGVFGAVILFLFVTLPAICFFMIAFLVAVPAAVEERCGVIDAIGRSWSLSAGHRWKLLAMILIYVFVAMTISSAFSAVTMPFMSFDPMGGGSPFDGMMPAMVIQSFLNSLLLVLTYPAIAATYHNLRIAREGVTQESVLDIFE